MKISEFDFRIVKPKNEQGGYNSCSNDECVCNTPFLYGDEARYRLGEFMENENTEIELWTGMKDKNGTKIYEGDIIKISPKEAYIKQRLKENPFYLKGATLLVEFHIKDTFGFCFWGNEEKTGKALHPLDFWHKLYHYKEFGEDFEIEILGNIHENPTLLQTSQK